MGEPIVAEPLSPGRMMIRERLVIEYGEAAVDAMISAWAGQHEHAHPLMLRNHDPAPPARVHHAKS